MMSSPQGAGVWDWLSACLMMIGFTLLLGLSVYLMIALVHVDGREPPERVGERGQPDGWISRERLAS
ncbi:MAG TPA: hypothetical protein VJ891_02255 [Casimicrobiaceae bacterium]|nr:hypothetical protein [Casimicrobiaceae bacterium]